MEPTWKDDDDWQSNNKSRICVAGKSCFKGMHANWTETHNKVFDTYITSRVYAVIWLDKASMFSFNYVKALKMQVL